MPDESSNNGNSPSDERPLASPSSTTADCDPRQASAFGANLESLIAEAEGQAIPALGPLPPADAELLDLPLIDKDGISHDGRVLSPAPGATFFSPRLDLPCNTLLKTISQMSDSEVDDYVAQYKDLVRQAERALDFRRVVLGASQLEQSQRKDIAQRKLRGDKTKYVVKTVTMDIKTGKQVTKTASAQKLGDMLKMLEALQKLKEVKK